MAGPGLLGGTCLGPGVAESSGSLKVANLLVGGTMSLPGSLLGLRHPSTGAKPVGKPVGRPRSPG